MRRLVRAARLISINYIDNPANSLCFEISAGVAHLIHLGCVPPPPKKNTYERTTTFLRQWASAGAVGSMHAVWNDQHDTDPSATVAFQHGNFIGSLLGQPVPFMIRT